MADNYLEKRYDEVFHSQKVRVKRVGPNVDELLRRTRSVRGYNKAFVVSDEMLRRIAAVNSRIASARNQQVLRFRLVTRGPEADAILQHVRMGAALPELHLPFPGTEPEAFIVVCSTVDENRMVDIDLGISLQSMSLKAVEMGLATLIIAAFDHKAVADILGLPYPPLMILAVGKSAEQIELVPVNDGDSLHYYRDEKGRHLVPKIKPDQLLIEPLRPRD